MKSTFVSIYACHDVFIVKSLKYPVDIDNYPLLLNQPTIKQLLHNKNV